MLDLILWYLVISVIGLIVLPVAYRFLPFLSDRGYTLARTLGLLLWGFIFWILASLHILQNNTGGVLVALLLLGLLSFWIGGGLQSWRNIFSWLRTRARLVIISELLFIGAFIFLAVLRSTNPQITGTEKPMELAFINSILRSPSFPPADPWLSGYSISYYYFGYVLVAMLSRLTGVVVGISFNLMISLVFALTAIGAYGILNSLLAWWSQRRQAQGKSGIFSQGWALLAPMFILLVSNLEGGFEVLHAKDVFWQDNGLSQQSTFWSWLSLDELNLPPSKPYQWSPNRPGGIWWWRASRVIQDYNLETDVKQAIPGFPLSSYIVPIPQMNGQKEVIDEFPFFSYYLADLHPHVLAMPFVMLVVALALNLYLRGAQESLGSWDMWAWIRQGDFWVTSLAVGALGFFNTWDFPIYVALFSAVFTLVRVQQIGWQWRQRLLDFFQMAILLGIAGFMLYIPFYIGFSSQAGGILPSMVFFTRGVNFWIMFGSLLTPLVIWLWWLRRNLGTHFVFRTGLLFAVIVVGILWVGSFLLGILGLNLSALGSLASTVGGGNFTSGLAASLSTWGSLFTGLQGGSSSAQIIGEALIRRLEMPGTWITLLLVLAFTWGLLASLRKKPAVENQPEAVPATGESNGFVLLLVLLGVGLTLVPEFVYLRDQFGTRMNTVFKFYFQTWMLWGLAAAFASVLIFNELKGFFAWVGKGAVLVVIFLSLIYPLFGISDRVNFQQANDWTLDGNAYLARYDPDEWSAMMWLSTAPYGVIAEAIGGSYGPAARMATQSGLPNVLGWPGHEGQWRGGGSEIGSRESDISTLYRTRDWNEAQAILEQYQIRYVVVGNLERSTYQADVQNGLRALDEQKFSQNLRVAFQNSGVTIYEVSYLNQVVAKEFH
jgi:YYY domain-containing protein